MNNGLSEEVSMYICLCRAIPDSRVKRLGACGVTTVNELVEALDLESDECCGSCLKHLDEFVALAEIGARELTYDAATTSASTREKHVA